MGPLSQSIGQNNVLSELLDDFRTYDATTNKLVVVDGRLKQQKI